MTGVSLGFFSVPGREDRLRELWALGLSATEIGKRLGCTKNVVVGRAHRLHLSVRPSPIGKRGPFDREHLMKLAERMSNRKVAEAMGVARSTVDIVVRQYRAKEPPMLKLVPIVEMPPVAPIAEMPAPVALTVDTTPIPVPRGRLCLYPDWQVKDARYWSAIREGRVLECGDQLAHVGAVYCRKHMRQAHAPERVR